LPPEGSNGLDNDMETLFEISEMSPSELFKHARLLTTISTDWFFFFFLTAAATIAAAIIIVLVVVIATRLIFFIGILAAASAFAVSTVFTGTIVCT
jgi:hypothetical protein